ncbi:Scaffold protein for [4Fe-4S] cluster assembly ApbC, MRP-like [Pseudoalteromonas luteoviolacea B = ATCC 29581]|nr:Scaffold protein for [4Fe-4S] cluster assembly ApbC, MRP-like [Pseudoalteromonas luteoviolacea B = ATCC 29581]
MFNIKSWFSPSVIQHTELETLLASYRNSIFPLGIEKAWIVKIDKQDEIMVVNLTLPFAAESEKPKIEAYLSHKLNNVVTVNINVELPNQTKFKGIKHIVLVASGKGGVGKSTTTVNLAYALKQEGGTVGVLDADIYGPSIPSLLGLIDAKPSAQDEKTLMTINKAGLKTQSIGYLVPSSEATVWRGPMASQALTQLLNETQWGELDYLVVDMPPGTGDIQLTMSQKVPASGAIIVTTPQDLALADAEKGIAMFNKVNMPILGLVENMSYFICGQCGAQSDVFGTEGGTKLAMRHGVPLLAEIPLHTAIRIQGEQGSDSLSNVPNIDKTYRELAKQVASELFYQQTTAQTVEILMTDD